MGRSSPLVDELRHHVVVDQRLDSAPVVEVFAHAVRPLVGVVGFYAVGSLASGDFQPAVSDLDLVAVIERELTAQARKDLHRLHKSTLDEHPAAAKLHCAYVPQDQVDDEPTAHLNWAHGELFRRPLTGIARAELLRGAITVLGPPPADLLAPMSPAALRLAARAELTGYWRTAVRKPWLWLEDGYVDLGLLTLARAEATLVDDQLISKHQALDRLHRFHVPPDLVEQIGRRRRGEDVTLRSRQRVRRAGQARRLCALGIRDLLRAHPV